MDFDKPNGEASKVFIVSKQEAEHQGEHASGAYDRFVIAEPIAHFLSLPPTPSQMATRFWVSPPCRGRVPHLGHAAAPLGLGGLPSSLLVSRCLPLVTGAICSPRSSVLERMLAVKAMLGTTLPERCSPPF